jgi:hypothetical protein
VSGSTPPSGQTRVATDFVPGLELARAFFSQAVQPLLATRMPAATYAAALLGPGSDVLGFDTPVSTDRDWGPRLQLFLPEPELAERAPAIDRLLRNELPSEFFGFATGFSEPDRAGHRYPLGPDARPVNHLIEITSVERFAFRLLGFSPLADMGARQWLLAPQERLLELTAGEVFVDPFGELTKLRERLRYYPRQIWLYLMAAQWRRLGRREELAARAGMSGDDLGSRLLVASLVREIIHLAFLLERRYAPWDQWLTRAFSRLRCAARLGHALSRALAAYDWMQRELRLMDAYAIVTSLHNNLGLTRPLPTVSERGSRGFLRIEADKFARALAETVEDEELKPLLPALAGGVDQLVASDEVILDPSLVARLGVLYEDMGESS